MRFRLVSAGLGRFVLGGFGEFAWFRLFSAGFCWLRLVCVVSVGFDDIGLVSADFKRFRLVSAYSYWFA